MSEYTPTTENVRSVFAHGGAGQTTERRRAMFDRWLAAHDAEVQAQVAEEPEWEYGWHTGSTVSLIGRRDQIDEWLMVRGWKLGEGDWGSRVMRRRVAGTWEVADADG